MLGHGTRAGTGLHNLGTHAAGPVTGCSGAVTLVGLQAHLDQFLNRLLQLALRVYEKLSRGDDPFACSQSLEHLCGVIVGHQSSVSITFRFLALFS